MCFAASCGPVLSRVPCSTCLTQPKSALFALPHHRCLSLSQVHQFYTDLLIRKDSDRRQATERWRVAEAESARRVELLLEQPHAVLWIMRDLWADQDAHHRAMHEVLADKSDALMSLYAELQALRGDAADPGATSAPVPPALLLPDIGRTGPAVPRAAAPAGAGGAPATDVACAELSWRLALVEEEGAAWQELTDAAHVATRRVLEAGLSRLRAQLEEQALFAAAVQDVAASRSDAGAALVAEVALERRLARLEASEAAERLGLVEGQRDAALALGLGHMYAVLALSGTTMREVGEWESRERFREHWEVAEAEAAQRMQAVLEEGAEWAAMAARWAGAAGVRAGQAQLLDRLLQKDAAVTHLSADRDRLRDDLHGLRALARAQRALLGAEAEARLHLLQEQHAAAVALGLGHVYGLLQVLLPPDFSLPHACPDTLSL